MRQKPKKKQQGCVFPLVLLAIIFILFLGYCKFAGGWGLSESIASNLPSETSYPEGTYEEKLQAISRSMPQAKQILNHIDEYPDEILDLLLRNPETKDFVLDYPKNKNGTTSKPDISKECKKGKLPHFLQWDKRWGYDSYGSSNIAISGCGPTCLSMVYTALTGKQDYDPKTMAEFSNKNGYYISGSGTSWSFMTDGAKRLGLSVRELPLSADGMKSELNRGRYIIAILGPGDFTTSGHFIVIHDTDRHGNFRVLDPNSNANTKKTWSYEKLSGQILNMWSYSAEG